MAEFIVTAPDGKKYRVDAPDQATALQRVQLHLGSKPSEATANPEAAAPVARETRQFVPVSEYEGKEPLPGFVPVPDKGVFINTDAFVEKQRERDGALQTVREDASQLGKGFLGVGSYLDDAAAPDTEAMGLPGELGPEIVRAYQRKAEEDRPNWSLALNIGGGLISGLPLASAAPALPMLPGLGGRMLSSAAYGGLFGGLEGALYGSGEGKDIDERMSNAQRQSLTSALIGSGVGVAMPLASSAIGGLYEAARNPAAFKRMFSTPTPESEARETVGRALMADTQAGTPDLTRYGEDAMLADVGPTLRGELDLRLQRLGPGAVDAAQNIDTRVGRASEKINTALNQSLGTPDRVDNLTDALMQRTRAQRNDAYNRAYAVPMMKTEQLKDLLSRVPGEVRRRSEEMATMRGRLTDDPPPFPDALPPPAKRSPAEPGANDLDLEFDQLRQELGSFFRAHELAAREADQIYNRPFSQYLRQTGGIDPNSPLGKELYSQDITPKTAPGLFRKGGRKDIDDINIDQVPGLRGKPVENGYVERNAALDALISEYRGKPVLTGEQELALRNFEELEGLYDEYVALSKVVSPRRDVPFPGDDVGKRTPDMREMDDITRELADQASRARIKGTFNREGTIRKLRRDLLEELDLANPEFKRARAIAADVISEREAIEFGGGLFSDKVTLKETADRFKGMTGPEQTALRKGIRAGIDERLGRAKRLLSDPDVDAEEAKRAIRDLSSRNVEEKLKIVLGEAEAEKLLKQIDTASTAFELKGSVARNSATFGRQFANRNDEALNAPGVFGMLREGKPVESGRKLAQAMFDMPEGVKQQRQQARDRLIAQYLTQMPGQMAMRQSIEQFMKPVVRDETSDALARALTEQLRRRLPLPAYSTVQGRER